MPKVAHNTIRFVSQGLYSYSMTVLYSQCWSLTCQVHSTFLQSRAKSIWLTGQGSSGFGHISFRCLLNMTTRYDAICAAGQWGCAVQWGGGGGGPGGGGGGGDAREGTLFISLWNSLTTYAIDWDQTFKVMFSLLLNTQATVDGPCWKDWAGQTWQAKHKFSCMIYGGPMT